MSTPNNSRIVSETPGIGIGAAIAIVLSFTTNHSVLWAIIHALFGWLYVFYRLAGCGGDLPPLLP